MSKSTRNAKKLLRWHMFQLAFRFYQRNTRIMTAYAKLLYQYCVTGHDLPEIHSM